MGSLQPGIPLPSLLPKGWPIIVIDLKDCFFFTILHECDKERFAFSVPTFNRGHPMKRYHWKVLPKGMLNSPTLCQYFLQQPLEMICKQFPQSIIYHYMDDILLADPDINILERMFDEVKTNKQTNSDLGDCKSPLKKIQSGVSINYPGYRIGLQKVRLQKVQIRGNQLRTLKDFRSYWEISTGCSLQFAWPLKS